MELPRACALMHLQSPLPCRHEMRSAFWFPACVGTGASQNVDLAILGASLVKDGQTPMELVARFCAPPASASGKGE